ncbi:hypothetical protein NQK81_35470 [Amycolatopsis roodepoortensis]|uniref:hypothetical protein n=1 Tax=Amycolatopsis roodepoortensis TaxID=700274 RepID=UPI00214AF768|nr:hypothetical protein [Amycolatopsis roodepoortensis]UUV30023.1 hypothetical protein NQK81_35470 [Amycolatopsis roodepoortensis]
MRKAVLSAVLGASLAFAVTTALPATSAATPSAASCTWVASDLPVPAGASGGSVAVAGPNGYLAGVVWKENKRVNVLWHHREVAEMPPPPNGAVVQFSAISGRGEIVGYQSSAGAGTGFRYHDGVYETLPSPPGVRATATAINESGDIVGYVGDGRVPYQVILWPANAPGSYRIIADGRAVGIDDAGRVVTEPGLVWSPDGSSRKLAGYGDLVIQRYQGERIVGLSWAHGEQLIEWDVNTGAVLGKTPGTTAMGINANGLLAAWYFNDGGSHTLGIWRNRAFLGDFAPASRISAVTDDDQLAGSHGPASPWVPATWSCVSAP